MSSEHIVSRIKEINARIQEIENICTPQKPKNTVPSTTSTSKQENFSDILQEILSSKQNSDQMNIAKDQGIPFSKPLYNEDMWNTEIENAAIQTDVDADLLRAIIRAESSYNPVAQSSAGAIGLMQLMPKTADSVGVRDMLNPQENILGGAKHLKELLNYYKGNIIKSIAAYNAGIEAVDQANGIPAFEETKNYVPKVLSYYYTLRNNK